MAKKETPQKPEESDLEAHVKEMMEVGDAASAAAPKNSSAPEVVDSIEPQTAPEITELPQPDEPPKIKILPQDDAEEPLAEEEVVQTDDSTEQPDASQEESVEADVPESTTDSATDEAVDDIVRHESDELLAAEDQELEAAFKPQEKKTFWQKTKAFVGDIWKNPKKRKIAIGVSVALVFVIGAVPVSRYFILNSLGVRSSAQVVVLDESTLQPLRNVTVSVRDVSAKTDENGFAKVEKIKLGSAGLKIERRAFAIIEKKITVGWGSNPLGEERLRPTGTQYAFELTDFLSGKGVVKAEATSMYASAFSDENGKLLLTMEDPPDEIAVTITKDQFRTEEYKLNADSKETTRLKLVPFRKHAYISRRDAGRYDVYAAYIDGKDESLLLKGSGNERDDMVLVPHPKDNVVALVSTRAGKHNDDGFLLSDLTVLDVATKKSTSVQTSERIQIIGWFDERLVYVRVVSGTSAGNPKRNRLMAYHIKDQTNNELASSNYFNDVMAVGDRIFYAPSAAYQNGVNVSLFSVKADGTDKKVIRDNEIWNMFRTSYDHIALSAPGAWYDYRLGDELTTKLSGEPAELTSLVFTNNPSNTQALWTESRDGKGVLIVHDIKSGEDKTLRTQSGLKNPTRWLNDTTVVYRIKTDAETADYALSLDGGEPRKIADVTNTDGVDRWYYY